MFRSDIIQSPQLSKSLPKLDQQSIDLSNKQNTRKLNNSDSLDRIKPMNTRQQSIIEQKPEDKKQDFPNLRSLAKYIQDPNHKKSLEHIIKKNPNLAQSLDLYAGGTVNVIIRQRYNQTQLLYRQIKTPIIETPAVEQEKKEGQTAKQLPKKKFEVPTFPKYEFDNAKLLKIQQNKLPKISFSEANFSNLSNLLNDKQFDGTIKSKLFVPSLQPNNNIVAYRKNNKPNQIPKLNYHIGPGNNSELVKRIMNDRKDLWQEVPINSLIVHFKWQQSYQGYNYEKMTGEGIFLRELVNLFEFHKEITSKIGLVKSLQRQYNFSMTVPFNIIPFVFIINFEERAWDQDIIAFKEYYNKHFPPSLKKPEVKESLNLNFYRQRSYISPYKFGQESSNEQQKYISQIQLQDVFKSDESYLWLLKPADWNRGEGVHVFQTLEQLENLLTNYYNGWYQQGRDQLEIPEQSQENGGQESKNNQPENKSPEKSQANKNNKGYFYKCRQFVIQKYIEHPFLIHQRKFDIRVWVLMTHNLQFFIFKEGYIRTSSQPFTLQNENPFVHLTNNAVQKHSKSYGLFENGNQLSYRDFENYLDETKSEFNFRKQALPVIKENIQITMYSVRKNLNKFKRKYCFQIFGYDFMIDKNFKVWLIEINTNPCIEESSPLLQMLVPRMIDDALKMTLDVVFKPENSVDQLKPIQNQGLQSKDKNSELQNKVQEDTVNGKNEKQENLKIDYSQYINRQKPGTYPVANYEDNESMWEFLGQY